MLLVTCVDQLNGQESEEVWAWDGSSWQLINNGGPAPLVVTGIAYDTDQRLLFRYGGLPLDSNTCDRTELVWTAATGWDRPAIVDTPQPEACDHIKLIYDATRGQIVMFGGGQLQELSELTTTWDGEAWHEGVADRGPAPRAHHELVYDATHEQTFLYGGFDGSQVFDDFWSWDGEAWSELDFEGPGPRSHAAMAASPEALLLFGGATSTSTFGSLTDETWLLTDGAWTSLDVEGPSARGSAALGYDRHRDVFVLYGGFSADGGELGDTWEFDGSAWSCFKRCETEAATRSSV
ncbi:MAG TPA: hypothetical protein VEX62_07585 [Candidatus Limnocylindrales bacterium]|nr:hypothetical protein [Candidatus Limnocylindrales bacterium]